MAKLNFCSFYANRPPVKDLVLDDETKFVDQSEADMCSLKAQLDRYGINGLVARFEEMKDKFGFADTRLVPSFSDLQNRIVEGEKYFNALPSEIREKYGFNAGKFFDEIAEHPEQAQLDGFISEDKAKELLRNVKRVVGPVTEVVESVKNDNNDSAI